MNRGSMSKQISTAPKSKSKKVKKMQFGGMATAMPGAPAGSQMDKAAAIAQMQATQGRPGMGDMPMPMVSQPRGPRPGMGDMPRGPRPGLAVDPVRPRPGMPLMPGMGRPGMGDMPRIGLPGKPGMGPRTGMGDMPPPMVSQPGTGRGVFGGGPGRGGPAPMPAMATPMKKGGAVKKAKGGKIDGCCMKGHTRARMK